MLCSCLVAVGAMCLPEGAVSDCGIYWSYAITFCNIFKHRRLRYTITKTL